MQFKYPEILFFLFLLLIPLLIHLFQLQKFRKEAFTNVNFLKKIDLESRKSAELKKLLILLSRMLAMGTLIVAFAQPYIAKNKGLEKRENIIYIDNSLSMQATGESRIDKLQNNRNLLIDAVQGTGQKMSLISNNKFMANLDSKSLNKELIALDFYPVKKDLNQVLLQINDYFKKKTNTLLDVYLISDFQSINNTIDVSLINPLYNYNFVDLSTKEAENISLDTLWLVEKEGRQLSLRARLSSWAMTVDDLSVSLFLNEELYGKAAVSMAPGSEGEIEFLIPSDSSNSGKLTLTDHKLNFDNELYFNIPKKKKGNVLIIGKQAEFFDRIYQKKEFNLTKTTYAELDQRLVESQDLIIINELDRISNPLRQNLSKFVEQKGNLVIIPSRTIEMKSYNDLLLSLDIGILTGKFEDNKSVSRINYEHPFFDQVFEQEIYNFQFPVLTEGYYGEFKNAAPLLEFDDLSDFVSQNNYFDNKVFWVSSPLSDSGNRFVNSPLIVPIFYNFSIRNENDAALYLSIGTKHEISAMVENSDDSPLKITQNDTEFIPLQTKSGELVKVTTEEFPLDQGIYELKLKEKLVQKLAFNYDRIESNLNFNQMAPIAAQFENIQIHASIDEALKEGNNRKNNKDLWQLFIIFALVFLILEILLQKYLK